MKKINPRDTAQARALAEDDARAAADEAGEEFDMEDVEYPPTHILKDKNVPSFTNTELLNAFLMRLDNKALEMMPYKELALKEKAETSPSFKDFETEVEARMDRDVGGSLHSDYSSFLQK